MKEFVPKLALIEGKLNKLDTLERKLDWITDKVKKPKSKVSRAYKPQTTTKHSLLNSYSIGIALS